MITNNTLPQITPNFLDLPFAINFTRLSIVQPSGFTTNIPGLIENYDFARSLLPKFSALVSIKNTLRHDCSIVTEIYACDDRVYQYEYLVQTKEYIEWLNNPLSFIVKKA